MFRTSIYFICFAAFVQSAAATPPDLVDVTDSFLGLSPDKIFLLRATRDNLGVYEAEQRDVTLVEIDRATGQARLDLVYHSRSAPTEPSPTDAAPTRMTTARLAADPINPFAVLQAQSATVLPLSEAERGEIARRNDLLEISFENQSLIEVSAAALLAQAFTNLAALAEHIGDYPRLAPVGLQDLIGQQPFSTGQCRIDAAFSLFDFSGKPPARLVQLECENEGQKLSMLLPVLP